MKETDSELPSGIIIKPYFYLSFSFFPPSSTVAVPVHHAFPLRVHGGVISTGDNYCVRPELRIVTCLITITNFLLQFERQNRSRTASRNQSFQWVNAMGAILCCIYATMEWDL